MVRILEKQILRVTVISYDNMVRLLEVQILRVSYGKYNQHSRKANILGGCGK